MANTVEVLSGYDTQVYLATEQLKTINESITDIGTIVVGNVDNSMQLPKITIEPTSSLTLNNISDGSNTVTLSLGSLEAGDSLVLDFKNQEYLLNGGVVLSDISFSDSLVRVAEDTSTTLTIDAVGGYDINVEYTGYSSEETISFLETFSVSYKQNFAKTRDYLTDSIVKSKITKTDYDISFSKLNVSDEYLNDFLAGNRFRIKFNEQNPLSLEDTTHVLLGVNFEDYKGGFNKIDDLIITDVSGFAKDLIVK